MGFSSLTMLYYFILPVVLGYALIWKVGKYGRRIMTIRYYPIYIYA